MIINPPVVHNPISEVGAGDVVQVHGYYYLVIQLGDEETYNLVNFEGKMAEQYYKGKLPRLRSILRDREAIVYLSSGHEIQLIEAEEER